MSEFDKPIETIFDGSNFRVWSEQMSSFLKNSQFWPYVTGAKPVMEDYGDDIAKFNDHLGSWDLMNNHVLSLIKNTCASSMKPQFHHLQTAKEVWDFLSQKYSIANEYWLREKLHSLKQQKGQSLNDFLLDIQDVWDQLARFEFEPTFNFPEDAAEFAQNQEKLKVMQFLMALDTDYHPARDSLLHRGKLPKLENIAAELTRVSTNGKKIHHSHPEHPLEKRTLGTAYKCRGCKMEGMGSRYSCKFDKCGFDMHEECLSPAPVIIFKGHEYKFFEKLPLCECESKKCKVRRWCDACGKAIDGYLYHCQKNEMSFHPRCAKLDSEIPCEGVKFRLQEEGPSYQCFLCGKKRLQGIKKKTGWSYVSEYGCDFHVNCFMEFLANLGSSSEKSAPTEEHLELALRGTTLTRKPTYKGKSGDILWKGLKIFFSALFSILLGDPTTLIATSLAHIVTETFLHIG